MNFKKLENYIDNITVPGCDIIVYHKHREVFRRMSGYRNILNKTPMTGNELYFLYSCTKVATCTAAMQLVEAGKMGLDDKISRYLPEFEHMIIQNDSGELIKAQIPITIRHLFTMTAGFTYNLETENIKEAKKNPTASTRDIIKAIAKDPLIFEPGTHYCYSLCHDVLAGVVEEVSGMRFSEYMKKYILNPLGMERTTFVPDKKAMDNMAALIFCEENGGYSDNGLVNVFRLCENYESGGAGLISCVEDYIKLMDSLASCGVSADGYRILSKQSIDLMKTNQLNQDCKRDFDKLNKKGYGYGLGVRTLITKEYGAKSPLGEFGWDGAACSYCLADTQNGIAVFYAQHTMGSKNGEIYNVVHPKIRNLIYEAMSDE